jgi:hypothetical protein
MVNLRETMLMIRLRPSVPAGTISITPSAEVSRR